MSNLNNFLKVFRAASRNLPNICILVFCVTAFALFPSFFGILLNMLGLGALAFRILPRLNNSEFISQQLKSPQNLGIVEQLESTIVQLKQKEKSKYYLEVIKDVTSTKQAVFKILQNYNSLAESQKADLSSLHLLPDTLNKMFDLFDLEQNARTVLNRENLTVVQKAKQNLEAELEKAKDESKIQIQEALKMKQNQLSEIDKIQDKIQQINSLTFKMVAELENIGSVIGKISTSQSAPEINNQYLLDRINKVNEENDVLQNLLQKTLTGSQL